MIKHAYWLALNLAPFINLLLLARLISLGTRKIYPAFFGFIAFQLFGNAIAILLGTTTVAYRHFWVVADPLNSVFYVLMIREAHRRAFSDYPGVASLAKWVTYGAAIAALVSLALMLNVAPEKHLNPGVVISYSLLWEECITFGLTTFILFTVFLLWRFPIPLEPNLAKHILILSVVFLMDSILIAMVPQEASILAQLRNFGIAILWIGAFLSWLLLLRKERLTSVIQVRTNLSAEEQGKLFDQLQAFNKVLRRSKSSVVSPTAADKTNKTLP